MKTSYLKSAPLMSIGILAVGLVCAGSAHAFQAVVTPTSDGVQVKTEQDSLRITVCSPSVVHITGGPGDADPHFEDKPWIIQRCAGQPFTLDKSDKAVILKTEKLQVKIALDTGTISFLDKTGSLILSESEGCNPCPNEATARTYVPLSTSKDSLYKVEERFWMPDDQQAMYGLGQHQSGMFDYSDSSVVLSQVNTSIAIPFLVSTSGYGLIWNTASRSIVDNQFPKILKFTASAAKGMDFYYLYGPEFDQMIHEYRELTGHAPLFGKWAYGLFQSKDRYKSQGELEQIVGTYRNKHIPVDTIVQDWQWWDKWGGSAFNANYPDFAGTVDRLHKNNAHIMISIWPKFDKQTEIWRRMNSNGFLLPKDPAVYDATNPKARDLYWKLLASTLLAKGVDAFWLDAPEPEQADWVEGGIQPGQNIYFGDAALYTNIFPFMHTLGIYEHWRKTTDEKRVFILTRSSFLGQQRNAAASWSGDLFGSMKALTSQIPAGLNFALSGVPYWTTDIGGYGFPSGSTTDPKYQEVFTRWFEFGAFCPIFRIHGHRDNDQNEIWSYGPAVPILVNFDKLRYRLLPYIYSLAWKVTSEDYTMMRPLVMDWRTDQKVWRIGNQFMFGPAILVNPVTEAGVTSRSVYLPAAAAWYDFWTGKQIGGGQAIMASAPIDRIPIYVRAGSIVPMGPEVEYAAQLPDNTIELRIYRGANGSFTLYQDQGDSYAYEHGYRATIPINWDDASRTLTIGERDGSFPNMPAKMLFNVVLVDALHGNGPQVSTKIDRAIFYSGRAVVVKALTLSRQ
jgi:alpha-D-xyloside xylohydrolase